MRKSLSRHNLNLFLFAILFSTLTVAQAQDRVTLALNWKPEPQFGGFYAAKIDNFFTQHKLDVELVEGGSGTPTVQMLANKKIDFAIVSAEEVAINNDRNPSNRVVALYAAFQTNPQMIMCRKELNFKSLGDVFASKTTLAWQSGLTYAQFLKNKFKPKDLKLVPYLGGVTTILNDKNFCQQGFATSEPITAAGHGLNVDIFLIADEGFNPYTTVLATRADTLEKNPDLAKRLTLAVREGWQAYLKNPDKTNKYMFEHNKSMDLVSFSKSSQEQAGLMQSTESKQSGLGTMTTQRWQLLLDQLQKLNVIHSQLQASEQFKNLL